MFKRRFINIFLIVIVTPLLGILLSFFTSYFAEPSITNNNGIGDGKALIVIGAVIYGVLGIVASLVAGPLVAHFVRRPNHSFYQLLGYIIPSFVAFSIVLVGFISVVILQNPSPY